MFRYYEAKIYFDNSFIFIFISSHSIRYSVYSRCQKKYFQISNTLLYVQLPFSYCYLSENIAATAFFCNLFSFTVMEQNVCPMVRDCEKSIRSMLEWMKKKCQPHAPNKYCPVPKHPINHWKKIVFFNHCIKD